MKKAKKIVAIILAIVTILSCFSIVAFAKTTSKQKIANWNAVNPKVASSRTVSYTIRGNLLSQKKITVVAASSSANFNYDSNAINFYKNNAKFRVDIYKNGTWQRAYIGNLGQNFYLPRGASNYTVVVKTYFNNWNGNKSACWNAAQGGYYNLKY